MACQGLAASPWVVPLENLEAVPWEHPEDRHPSAAQSQEEAWPWARRNRPAMAAVEPVVQRVGEGARVLDLDTEVALVVEQHCTELVPEHR